MNTPDFSFCFSKEGFHTRKLFPYMYIPIVINSYTCTVVFTSIFATLDLFNSHDEQWLNNTLPVSILQL